MGFPLVPKLVTVHDLEQRIGRYFALFHLNWDICEPVVSQLLKLDPYCVQIWPKESSIKQYISYDGIFRDYYSKNWNCA